MDDGDTELTEGSQVLPDKTVQAFVLSRISTCKGLGALDSWMLPGRAGPCVRRLGRGLQCLAALPGNWSIWVSWPGHSSYPRSA